VASAMAKVVAFVPDLLFGSSVVAAVQAAGHDCVLVASLDGDAAAGADALIIDLTADAPARLAAAAPAIESGLPALAFYAHVEAGVRELASSAGVGLVVPRSRMAREGPALVQRLLTGREAAASGPEGTAR
jgi:hypothetical protein